MISVFPGENPVASQKPAPGASPHKADASKEPSEFASLMKDEGDAKSGDRPDAETANAAIETRVQNRISAPDKALTGEILDPTAQVSVALETDAAPAAALQSDAQPADGPKLQTPQSDFRMDARPDARLDAEMQNSAPTDADRAPKPAGDMSPVMIKGEHEIRAQVGRAETAATAAPAEPNLRVRTTNTEAQADPRIDAARTAEPSDETLKAVSDVVDVRTRGATDFAPAAEKLMVNMAGRDAATPGLTESILTLAPATTSATPTQTVSTAGLTPTAPSIPVASPTEISGIILNALKNGVEPQEQLIVQLDPPELGRVQIDFKFDANGVQQIVVSAENPEALKRLRELHFELTEALKDQGLSDQNMSFQQHAEGRTQSGWDMPDSLRSQNLSDLGDDRDIAEPIIRRAATSTHPARLDLTL